MIPTTITREFVFLSRTPRGATTGEVLVWDLTDAHERLLGAHACDAMYLHRLYVYPRYRSRGVATALMLRVLAWAQAARIGLLLRVDPFTGHGMTAQQLRRFYEGLGFVRLRDDYLTIGLYSPRLSVPTNLDASRRRLLRSGEIKVGQYLAVP
jgi:GNAT superfamily N-acetyltransferase